MKPKKSDLLVEVVEHIDIKLQTAEGELTGRTDHDGAFVIPESRHAQSIQLYVRVYDFASSVIPRCRACAGG